MDSSSQNPAKLFVGNLSYNVTSEQLKELFSQHGTVVEALVLSDKFSGRSKGFGFVTMGSAQEAEAAVAALNEYEFEGRRMVVNVARPKAPREDRGGFGGRGGFSGGRGGYNGGRSGGRSNDRGGWNN